MNTIHKWNEVALETWHWVQVGIRNKTFIVPSPNNDNKHIVRVCRNNASMSIEEGLIEGSTLRGEDGGQGGYVVLLSQCLGQLQGLLHIEEEAEG